MLDKEAQSEGHNWSYENYNKIHMKILLKPAHLRKRIIWI